MSVQLVTYGSSTTPTVTADANASKNSVVQRDSAGGATVVALTATSVTRTGGEIAPVAAKTADYTLVAATDEYVEFDATSGVLLANLPAASGCIGQKFIIKKITAANTVTITPNGADTIDGAAT